MIDLGLTWQITLIDFGFMRSQFQSQSLQINQIAVLAFPVQSIVLSLVFMIRNKFESFRNSPGHSGFGKFMACSFQ